MTVDSKGFRVNERARLRSKPTLLSHEKTFRFGDAWLPEGTHALVQSLTSHLRPKSRKSQPRLGRALFLGASACSRKKNRKESANL